MVRMGNKRELLHADVSEVIIGCCFEVMRELGSGISIASRIPGNRMKKSVDS